MKDALMISKLKFVYSVPLDALFTKFLGQEYDEKVQRAACEKFIGKLRKEWDKRSDSVFKEIEKSSSLKWERKKFECFIVSKSLMSVSNPLITYVREDLELAVLVIVHELVHCNLAESPSTEYSNALKALEKKFKHYNKTVLRHVIVDLVLLQVVSKIFGKKTLDKIIRHDSRKPDYARAWKIALSINSIGKLESVWKKIEKYCE